MNKKETMLYTDGNYPIDMNTIGKTLEAVAASNYNEEQANMARAQAAAVKDYMASQEVITAPSIDAEEMTYGC